jgi:hypothetical protein
MGEKRNAHRILMGRGETTMMNTETQMGRIILNWVLDKYDGLIRTGYIWFRIGTSGGLL